MRFSCTEYAVVGLPAIGLSDSLQSFKGCVSQVAVVGLPVVSLLDGIESSKGSVSLELSMKLSVSRSLAYQTVQGMCFSCTEDAVVSLSDGVQSSKGCVSPALSMQLSISRSLAYRMVHNHLRDAFLLD